MSLREPGKVRIVTWEECGGVELVKDIAEFYPPNNKIKSGYNSVIQRQLEKAITECHLYGNQITIEPVQDEITGEKGKVHIEKEWHEKGLL